MYRPGAMPPLFGDTSAVLIVDDDVRLAELLAATLEPEGYVCTLAASAAEARARLAEAEFALALIDVLMPGESGLELADAALEEHPHLAVVMVTGVDDPAIAELALRSGAYGYLVKPVTSNEVIVAAANAGRRRCLEIERAAYRRRLEDRLGDVEGSLTD